VTLDRLDSVIISSSSFFSAVGIVVTTLVASSQEFWLPRPKNVVNISYFVLTMFDHLFSSSWPSRRPVLRTQGPEQYQGHMTSTMPGATTSLCSICDGGTAKKPLIFKLVARAQRCVWAFLFCNALRKNIGANKSKNSRELIVDRIVVKL
jgi:hypothetical protein